MYYKPVRKVPEIEGIMPTAVKQKEKFIKPLKPILFSWLIIKKTQMRSSLF